MCHLEKSYWKNLGEEVVSYSDQLLPAGTGGCTSIPDNFCIRTVNKKMNFWHFKTSKQGFMYLFYSRSSCFGLVGLAVNQLYLSQNVLAFWIRNLLIDLQKKILIEEEQSEGGGKEKKKKEW